MFGFSKKVNESDLGNYAKHYDKNVAYRLLKKLRKTTRNEHPIIAGSAGAIVSSLGSLLSAYENPEIPPTLKALIIGAIGYIIFPLDLIPDLIPGVGYTDDLATVSGLLIAVAVYSDFSLEKLDEEIDNEEYE